MPSTNMCNVCVLYFDLLGTILYFVFKYFLKVFYTALPSGHNAHSLPTSEQTNQWTPTPCDICIAIDAFANYNSWRCISGK